MVKVPYRGIIQSMSLNYGLVSRWGCSGWYIRCSHIVLDHNIVFQVTLYIISYVLYYMLHIISAHTDRHIMYIDTYHTRPFSRGYSAGWPSRLCQAFLLQTAVCLKTGAEKHYWQPHGERLRAFFAGWRVERSGLRPPEEWENMERVLEDYVPLKGPFAR